MVKVFTIGYEKREMTDFIDILLANKIDVIADLRIRPISRKKGFSKNGLTSELERNGIEYMHFVELGSPQEIRDQLHADWDYDNFFKAYNHHLDKSREPLERLIALAEKSRTCLLCFERDINQCHRKVVAERMKRMSPNRFEIIHLDLSI